MELDIQRDRYVENFTWTFGGESACECFGGTVQCLESLSGPFLVLLGRSLC